VKAPRRQEGTLAKDRSEARVGSIRAQRLEADAKLASDRRRISAEGCFRYARVVAGNDVEVAESLWKLTAHASSSMRRTKRRPGAGDISGRNAKQLVKCSSVEDIELICVSRAFPMASLPSAMYTKAASWALRWTASTTMLRIRQISKLRLVVAVPEQCWRIAQGEG